MHNLLLKSGKVASSKVLFSKRNRSYYKILLLQACNGSITVDGEKQVLNGDTIIFCYPAQEIVIENNISKSGFALFFQEEYFFLFTEHRNLIFRMPFFGYQLNHFAFPISKNQYAELLPIFQLMEKEYSANHSYHEQVLLSYLNILLLKIKSFPWAKNELVHKNDYTTLQIVMKYKQLVRQHCRNQHFVSYYAELLMHTSNYLNLMVKKVTGFPAGHIIHNQLILEAKRLLMHTKLSPKEVAYELGFVDHTYFSKFFKKRTGLNPLEWFNKYKGV